MDDRDKIIYNEELTNYCKELFGEGLVIKAYLDKWDPTSILQFEPFPTNDSNNGLEYNDQCIYIEFINGKLLCFSNSEWASISVVK